LLYFKDRHPLRREVLLSSSVQGNASQGIKLHAGCGSVILDQWINMDLEDIPGIQIKQDVRNGLPFDAGSVKYIFAEHFIEHLTPAEGVSFLKECHRVLMAGSGILRLSTPNLDWVWVTHYQLPVDDVQKRANAEMLNRAFYGWGHRNLYCDVTLTDALKQVGFSRFSFFKYGQSDQPELCNLERHEKSRDIETLPHVIIVQAYR
jgi:predicted SAM-dependent methyltransferase